MLDNLEKNMGLEWKTSHGTFKLDAQTNQWILDNAKMSMYNENRSYIYNKAFAYFKATREFKCEKKPLKIFQQIRDWAQERGLYKHGDVNTQYVKLQEEAGELAKALLQDDQPEVIDAIGDMVVVLTNLAHQRGVHIETCINTAYQVINKRTGKMINGTFVKDEK